MPRLGAAYELNQWPSSFSQVPLLGCGPADSETWNAKLSKHWRCETMTCNWCAAHANTFQGGSATEQKSTEATNNYRTTQADRETLRNRNGWQRNIERHTSNQRDTQSQRETLRTQSQRETLRHKQHREQHWETDKWEHNHRERERSEGKQTARLMHSRT